MTRRREHPFEKDKNIPYLQDFLDTLSEVTIGHVRNKLYYANDYFRTNFNKGILEVSSQDMLHFFKKYVDPLDIKKTSKRKWRHELASYYKYVQNYKKDIENEEFKIPIPSSKIFDFTGTMYSLEDFEQESQLLSIDIIKTILNFVYFTRPERVFIALVLIITSGARISEVLNIELKNLDLQNRWFSVVVKSRKTDKRQGVYFFPAFLVPILEHYIKALKIEYSEPIYLFQSENSHLVSKTIEAHLREVKKALGLKAKVNPHAYRDFLNTRRYELGCRSPFLEFLLNQSVKGVNPSSYMKKYKYRIKLRNKYDEYNPFTVDILPKVQL